MQGDLRFIILVSSVFWMVSCSNEKQSNPVITTDFCTRIHRNDSASLAEQLHGLDSLMKTKTAAYVLEDGAGAMVTRAWLSEYAQKSIDIQYFIFSTDNVGLIACDYLVRAANRGVKVRIIVDDIMVDADLEDIVILSSHENIAIRIYNPGVNLGKNLWDKTKKFTTDFRNANQRMHNKTFNVDGKVVITGGRNIADEYFDYDHEYNFRDRDILLLGEVTKDVERSFTEFWESNLSIPVNNLMENLPDGLDEPNRFDKLHEYACNPENFWPQVREKIENLPGTFSKMKNSGMLVWVDSIQFVSDVPGKNDANSGLGGGGMTTSKLIALVNNAKHSISIQTPYLITTELSRTLFRNAVKRGVKVRILTNSLASTDNLEAFSSYQKDRELLLETGVEIYEFRPDAKERMKMMTGELHTTLDHQPVFGLHAKSMVIDGNITVIGTFNLDPRSANLNTECISVIYSAQINKTVLKGMEIEFHSDNSWHTTTAFNPDSEVSYSKRVKTWTRRIVPKGIL